MQNIIHPLLGMFSIIKKIGSGSFATVYLGRNTQLQYPVALKIFKSNNDEDIQKSFNITKPIIHPFICKDFDLIKTPNGENCMIMEYVEGTTLLEYANNNDPLSKHDIQTIFGQLIISVDFLHSHNIIHRDLKCENVLIDQNKNIRLIDLNFSCQNGYLHSTICGSPGYVAPEMIKNELYGDSVDIWSLGIILYAITFGRLPFENNNVYELFNTIILKEPPYPQKSDIDENLLDLIKKMLVKNPKDRITIDEIKKHPFFTDGSNEKNYIFSQERMNYYIHELSPKTNLQIHILQQMKLITGESSKAINEIKSGKLTYYSMTYNILYKNYISNVQIKSYSSSLQNTIHEESKLIKNECDLPYFDHNDADNEKIQLFQHSTSFDGILYKDKQRGNKQIDLQLFLRGNTHFRRFNSIAKPLSGLRKRNMSSISIFQSQKTNLASENFFNGEETVSLIALPQLKIHEK